MIKQHAIHDNLSNNKSIIDFNPDNDVSHFDEHKFIHYTNNTNNFASANKNNNGNQDQSFNGDKKQEKDYTVKYLMTLAKGLYGTLNQ